MEQLLLIIDTHRYLAPVDMNSRKIARQSVHCQVIAVHCDCCGHRTTLFFVIILHLSLLMPLHEFLLQPEY